MFKIGTTSTQKESQQFRPLEEPKPCSFPLDRFMNNKIPDVNSNPKQLRVGDAQHGIIKRKVNDLAVETEKIAKGFVPADSAHNSKKSSSTSLNDSESGYTERLVAAKFKEVTFNKSAKPTPSLTAECHKNLQKTIKYSPKLYEEIKSIESRSPASVIRESTAFPSRVSVEHYNKSYLKQKSENNPVSKSSLSVKACRCSKNTPTQTKKNEEDFSRKNLLSTSKRVQEPFTIPNYASVGIVSSTQKKYQDTSVNTEQPFIRNTSLINVTSVRNDVLENKNIRKQYQVQEMPIVNIRPNLTKQTGPVIDIKVSKTCINKDNVAVVEYVHPEVLQENKFKRHCDIINRHKQNLVKYQKLSPNTSNYKVNKELKLQKILKDMLHKLNEKGPFVDRLKNSVNSLILLLNKIVPLHTAAIRYQNDNISLVDESIDLFFTNMDIVQEVIENELKNPDDKFCKQPDYLIKAINLLCGNIRSIFDVSGHHQSSVKAPINDNIEMKDFKQKSNIRNSKETTSKKCALETSKSMKSPLTSSTSNSIYHKDSTIPKSVYIPFKKLIPGGMYKQMEDAETLSEIELRRKRLEKIHEINNKLKKEIKTNNNSDEVSKENEDHIGDVQDILNRTFVIESEDEHNENKMAKKTYTTNNEIIKMPDADYEEDWEEEVKSSASSSDKPGSLKMESVVVEAQIHHSDKVTENNGISKSLNDLEPSPSLPEDHIKDLNSISEIDIYTNEITNKHKAISVAIQTEEKIMSMPVSQNFVEEKIIKNKGNEATEAKASYSKTQEIRSCPVLRMTNPITNSLVEVRFPEQSEKFHSSIHFQKSESKEEIKLFYNMKEDKTPNCKDETTVQEVSDKNDNASLKQEDNKNEQTKECTTDFENITMDFIGFLENKVTEMVNKFKCSESISEKLLSEKLTVKKNMKLSRSTSHNTGLECLKPTMPVYKSNSSLFSDKSTEELKFCKYVSRGCSPEIERLKLENLVSPPLTLQLKKDAPSQTDNEKLTDVCVGTEESLLETTVLKLALKPNNQFSFSDLQKENVKLKEVAQYDLISADQGLRWSNPDAEVKTTEKLVHNRLLPLPEDVLYEGSSNYDKNNINILESHICRNTANNNEEKRVTETTSEKNQIKKNDCKISGESYSNLSDGSLKKMNNLEDITAIPVSNIDEGDSQRTSQICNVITMTDNSKVFNIKSPASSQDTTIKENENHGEKTERAINNNLKNRNDNNMSSFRSQAEGDNTDTNLIKGNEYSEHAHLLYVRGSADPGLELSSKFESNNEHLFYASGRKEEKVKSDTDISYINSSEVGVNTSNGHVDQGVNVNEFVEKNSSLCKTESIERQVNIDEENIIHIPKLENNLMEYGDESNTVDAEEIPSLASSEVKNEINTGGDSPDYSKEVFDNEISLHSDPSTSISEDHITIYHYNSDMSEGEIGFVYTSNSYSSGEIKPLNMIPKVGNVSENMDKITMPDSSSTILEKPGPSSVPENVENNPNENINNGMYESSSSESINTEELQKLLVFEDKLDDEALKSLMDKNFLNSSKSSPDSQAVLHISETKK